MLEPQTPRAQGLYDPRFEHDACGMGMVADLHGRPSHQTVERALSVLACMDHRGASGAEIETGDGAGILMQIPDRFLRSLASLEDIRLPEQGHYGVGAVFLPLDLAAAQTRQGQIEAILTEESLKVLWWREVPVDPSGLGASAEAARPSIWQAIVVPTGEHASRSGIALDRLCFVARKRVEHEIDDLYFASLSARTLVYKGMLSAMQLAGFYPDLSHDDFESALALV
ncbi:MAG: glutamate synthase subunit alpha, partial [Actinobacteria bacterium]|nr:glutamate synthase subunit alpha [Actinomycetota bacterium]